MRRSAGAAVVVAAWLGGCRPELTEIMLEVDTDLVVPTEVEEIRVRAGSAREPGRFDKVFDLTAGRYALPISLGLVPDSDTRGAFRVVASGLRGGETIVERSVATSFVQGQILTLRIRLSRICRRVVCAAGETCGSGGGCEPEARDPRLFPFHGALGQDAGPPGDAGSPAPSWQTPLIPSTAPRPSGRYALGAAYDVDRRKIVIFGGSTTSGPAADLWEWDGAERTFTDRTPPVLPATWPPARTHHRLAYDPRRHLVLLFGGRGRQGQNLQDLWEWDGNAGVWTDRTPVTIPTAWPGARSVAGVAYDSGRGRLVVFGGDGDAGRRRNLWEWDEATGWAERIPATVVDPWPPDLSQMPMVYDAGRGRTLLFAGYDGGHTDAAWEWNGVLGTWKDRTPPTRPVAWPPTRDTHGYAYDPRRGTVLLFGGHGLTNERDLWEWDGGTGTWLARTPSPLPTSWPPGRVEHAVVYDLGRDVLVVFGGVDGGELDDLWEWRRD